MMNFIRSSRPLILSFTAAVILSACSSAQQNPAPVVSGNSTTGYGYNNGTSTTSTTSNPYGIDNSGNASNAPYVPNGTANTSTTGTTPYTPPATTTNTAPYTPPAATTTSSTGYVPNYSPVDTNATYHRVVQGDTVYNISKRYGISQDQLYQWNNLSDNTISIGQTLRVKPQGAGSGATNSTSNSYTSNAAGTHTVVKGDTVYNISKRYGMSQDQLRQLNNIQDNNIQLGQVLRVSGAASAPINTTPTTSVYTPPATNTAPTVANNVSNRTINKDNVVWQAPLANSKVAQTYVAGQTRGIQLSGTQGQTVQAAADGQVIYTGLMKNHGTVVIVQHDNSYLTAYGQLQNILVQDKQTVSRGQSLATLGAQPLHFELRQSGNPQDPTQYIPL